MKPDPNTSVFIRLLAVGCLFLSACQGPKKPSGYTPGQPLSFSQLNLLFPQTGRPFTVDRKMLESPVPDSVRIPSRIIHQFFPDSVFRNVILRGERTIYFPLGRAANPSFQILLLGVRTPRSSIGILTVFSPQGKFLHFIRLAGPLSPYSPDWISGTLGKKWVITLNEQWTLSSGRTASTQKVITINPDGSFTLILTNSAGPLALEEVYNPIGTLAARHRFSGDYISGNHSLVSIKDGLRPNSFRFFIQFYQEASDCSGELDGTANLGRDGVGIFKEKGGPCALEFHFGYHSVTLKEIGGCGAYRGIGCFFDGSFRLKVLPHKRKYKP